MPLLHDVHDLGGGDRFGIVTVYLFYFVVGPGPLPVVVAGVHVGKASVDLFGAVDAAGFDVVEQVVYLAFGGDQSGQVDPFALADGCVGL